MNKLLKHIALNALLLFPVQLLAETEPDTAPTPVGELDIFQVITPLLLVITLIFILAWMVKKINPGVPAMGKDINIISSTPLSGQSRLCLVRVGGKDILIGVTGSSVSHIKTFDEPIVKTPPKENPSDFSGQFKKLLTRSSKNG